MADTVRIDFDHGHVEVTFDVRWFDLPRATIDSLFDLVDNLRTLSASETAGTVDVEQPAASPPAVDSGAAESGEGRPAPVPVVAHLREHGPIEDADGRAATMLLEASGVGVNGGARRTLGELAAQGLIVRKVHGKRTHRIALAEQNGAAAPSSAVAKPEHPAEVEPKTGVPVPRKPERVETVHLPGPVTVGPPRPRPEPRGPSSVTARVEEAMRAAKAPKTATGLAIELGVEHRSIVNALEALERSGKVERKGGTWVLASGFPRLVEAH